MHATPIASSSFTQLLRNANLESAIAAGLNSSECVAFVDYCRVEDKYDFIRKLTDYFLPHRVLLLDDVPTERQKPVPGAHRVTTPPDLMYSDKSPRLSLTSIDLSPDFPDFSYAKQNYLRYFRNASPPADEFAINRCITSAFTFSYACFALARPRAVLIWNAFHPLSIAAQKAAHFLKIKCYYMEYGLLPGTMNFDSLGQMGGSRVTVKSCQFERLPITNKDRNNAENAIDYFIVNRKSRHPSQKDERFIKQANDFSNGRPLILFAGHNDLASGTFPYTPEVKSLHSPIFKSSAEAALEVFRIAENQGWAVLYKPHPLYDELNEYELPEHVMRAQSSNIIDCIDASDLTITVLSQSAYMARIRDRPVVLLGKLQLSGKGCVYECESISEISEKVHLAINYGFADKQNLAWRDHVARLLRYYLYPWDNDLTERVCCNDLHGACKSILIGSSSVEHFGLV